MDEYIFSQQLEACKSVQEETSYLEVLNYSDPQLVSVDSHPLTTSDDFGNFVARKGVFSPQSLKPGVVFTNGTRLVLQPKAQNPDTFLVDIISLERDDYGTLIREMQLPGRVIETLSAVGPFFWWTCNPGSTDPCLQIIFRKSDVQRNKVSRGWEMTLSYSFRTKVTSGYVKGTPSANIDTVLQCLKTNTRAESHPLLLPMVILGQEISPENDRNQRAIREKLRGLESAMTLRYQPDAAVGSPQVSPPGGDEDLELDVVDRKLADLQCEVLWKRPQAWQNAVSRIAKAMDSFWENLPPDDKTPELQKLHETLLCRLEYITTKLEGLEHYAHVTLERLSIQREVVRSLIDQRESRLALAMAAQQSRLAGSMKTLTLLGSLFLPGAFLSGLFSMPFFNFDDNMDGTVSGQIWIYFAAMAPLTIVVFAAWWMVDRLSDREFKADFNKARMRMHQLETHVTEDIRKRTGSRIKSWHGVP